jgi:2-phospho-L-lactate/phosphoenolpyruvate guanylyltransferase
MTAYPRTVRIIVPHRGLAAAKTRLAPVLDPAEREALARRLLARVLAMVRQACPDVVVITPAEALRPIVEEAGARLAVQHGMGLNEGLEEARAEAVRDGIELLGVLHGDLPNLAPDDVTALLGAVPAGGGVAVAPDRAGTGTNGLAQSPAGAIPFRFGAGSFARHRDAASGAGLPLVVVERPGLAFDLDTPADLARWLELGDAA